MLFGGINNLQSSFSRSCIRYIINRFNAPSVAIFGTPNFRYGSLRITEMVASCANIKEFHQSFELYGYSVIGLSNVQRNSDLGNFSKSEQFEGFLEPIHCFSDKVESSVPGSVEETTTVAKRCLSPTGKSTFSKDVKK